jgi:hypothetical protein
MSKVIVYQQSNGILAIVHPTGNLPLLEVARKDVPAGVAYLILDISELPQETEYYDAWEADFSNPDGYGIGADAWFAEQAAKEQA